MSEYWLQPQIEDWEEFVAQTGQLCTLFAEAAALREQSIHVVSCDEKTGIQALQTAGVIQPVVAGKIERREFNYIRHGTKVILANLEVATGKLIASHVLDTRKEADFLAHVAATVATASADKWIFIVDQLNTHYWASLVEWVADLMDDKQPLGKKGQSGILFNKKTRMAYLSNSAHRVGFVYIPKHCSWLNPVEVWFSGLTKRVLKRGNFFSKEDLKNKLLAYIHYYNENLAKKFSWSITAKNSIDSMIDKIKRAVSKIMS